MATLAAKTRDYNKLADLERVLPEVERQASAGSGTGENYLRAVHEDDYRPWRLEDAMAAYAPLREWRGNRGKDASASGDAYSLVQTAVDAWLALEDRSIRKLDCFNTRKNVVDLVHAYSEAYPTRCTDAVTHWTNNTRGYEGKLSYDVDRAFCGSDPDRASEEVKTRLAVAKIAQGMRKHSLQTADAPAEDASPEETLRRLLKEAEAQNEGLVIDVAEFITAMANAGLKRLTEADFITKLVALGKIERAQPPVGAATLRGQLADEKKIFASKRAETAKAVGERHGELVFPSIRLAAGGQFEPIRDSIPNVEAWLAHHGKDVWFDEHADQIMLGKRPVDDGILQRLRAGMHDDGFFASATLVKDALMVRARANNGIPCVSTLTVCAMNGMAKRVSIPS
jgi:hypothetical protein